MEIDQREWALPSDLGVKQLSFSPFSSLDLFALFLTGVNASPFNRRRGRTGREAALNPLSGTLPLRIIVSSMSASKLKYSESPPMHITSGTMFNPSDTEVSLVRNSASPRRRPTRTSRSHENKAGLVPLRHHHHHQRVANKVGGHSPLEKKSSSEGGHVVAPSTLGRSPLKASSRPDESEISEEGIVVPKFGDWDESNPSSGEAFTDIFNKVQEERQASATKVPMIIDDSFYLNSYHHETPSRRPTKFCCFNWGKKRG